jgi:hypothetical protein
MSLHSDTLSWFWFQANQSLLFLLSTAYLGEKQRIPPLTSAHCGVVKLVYGIPTLSILIIGYQIMNADYFRYKQWKNCADSLPLIKSVPVAFITVIYLNIWENVIACLLFEGNRHDATGQWAEVRGGIRCFSPKYAVLRRKSKDWLAWNQNQDNVSEWGNMSIHGLLFQWASTLKNSTKCVGLVQNGP